MSTENNWLDKVKWDANGLVPVIAQEAATNDVLMFAWMNREALALTAEKQRAIYWSRSRQASRRAGSNASCVRAFHLLRSGTMSAAARARSSMPSSNGSPRKAHSRCSVARGSQTRSS